VIILNDFERLNCRDADEKVVPKLRRERGAYSEVTDHRDQAEGVHLVD